MATLSVTTVTLASPDPGYAAADAAGDEFANSAGVFFAVKNGSGSSVNVTATSQYTARPGITSADLVTAVPAGETRILKFNGDTTFSDGDGLVQIAYSAATSVEVAAFK